MRNLMVDIETAGRKTNAVILSIGAVKFDPLKCVLGDQFYYTIDSEDSKLWGATTSESTMVWWADQDAEVREEAWRGQFQFYETLKAFAEFCGNNARVWCNAPAFDHRILRGNYDLLGGMIQCPWHWGSARDMRTVLNFVASFGVRVNLERGGEHHHALDDAIFQARVLLAVYERFNEITRRR